MRKSTICTWAIIFLALAAVFWCGVRVGRHSYCATPLPDRDSMEQVPSCMPLPISFQLAGAKDTASRSYSFALGQLAAQTPSGHIELRRMLGSGDTKTVLFAARMIGAATDLADAPFLIDAARHSRSDESVRAECVGAILLLLDRPSIPTHRDRSGDMKNVRALSAWLDEHKTSWSGVAYADYWGDELLLTLRAMREQTSSSESQEYFGQALYTLLLSRDARRAVPAIMRALVEADPAMVPQAVPPLLRALPIYIGHIDIPEDDKPNDLANTREAILAWWKVHSSESPGQWVVATLSQRAVQLPLDAPTEVLAWLDKTLRDGALPDQYAASLLLSYAFPAGNDCPLPDGTFLVARDDASTLLWEHLLQCRLAQVSYLRMIANAIHWDPTMGSYSAAQPAATQPGH